MNVTSCYEMTIWARRSLALPYDDASVQTSYPLNSSSVVVWCKRNPETEQGTRGPQARDNMAERTSRDSESKRPGGTGAPGKGRTEADATAGYWD